MNRLRTRARKRVCPADGQSLILFAICLPLLLVFVAFVVDGAHAFVDYRHLQNAADASALAAAQDVAGGGSSCATCASTANSYSAFNGFTPPGGLVACSSSTPSSTPNCYQWPYVDSNGVSHGDEVLVRLRNCTSTFFGGIVGVPSICESARSVARTTPLTHTTVIPGSTTAGTTIYSTVTNTTVSNGTTSYSTNTTSQTIPGTTVAGSTVFTTSTNSNTITTPTTANDNALFAADTSCAAGKGLALEGNNVTITGFVHSNGNFEYDGNSNSSIAGGTYGTSACPPNLNSQIFTSSPTLDTSYNKIPVPWPLAWIYSNICPSSGLQATYTLNSGAPGGTYCASSSITLNGQPAGPITLVAPTITITGNNQTLQGNYSDGNGHTLLAYATTGDLTITGNMNTFTGYLFAPDGTITIAKNNGANGFFEALDIVIPKNDFTMTGTGPGGTPGTTTSTTFTTTTTPVSTVGGITRADSTNVSTSTSTTITPASTATNTTITPVGTIPGTTTGNSTQTSTTGTTFGLGE